ncbi:MAG: hypothetical protein EBV30_11140 [Actinobacteria bacterium]|nr:hypothetical protein [Actinomycetota bacterium]
MANELIAPIAEDLRKEDRRFDIIKGIEHIKAKDEQMIAALAAAGCEAGDWVVKGANGLEAPGASASASTYPVWVGNDQLDSKATGKATILVGGGFIYRTTKFAAGSYTAGQNLTVKGGSVPCAADTGDAVLCRVYTAPDAQGVMEILVLNR